ncbi:MAG TPA: SbcC/MukB-like Walker B domain-containing protein, partial [Pirellulales bacterium]|nr:SbcC/MukB-like Walker B domain-containing protein [Pirellulales bacterium]
ILVAAIAYQYDLDPDQPLSDRFHFVVVDEMFSKVDDQHAEYALKLFEQFGLQLLIVAPLDAKARVTQPYVGCYLHAVKKDNRSTVFEMTAREFEETATDEQSAAARRTAPAPR